MAFLSRDELQRAVEILSEKLGFGKLCQRLAQTGAFVSRRRPASPGQLAERLYALTGGLRRDVPPTYAFHSVWSSSMSDELDKESQERLEDIAGRVNDCLTPRDSIDEGKEEELKQTLAEYEALLSTKVGPEAARLDMILKAVPQVADILREKPLVATGDSN